MARNGEVRGTRRSGSRRSRRRATSAPDGVLVLAHAETGETRLIRTGFAWTLFLFGGVLGLPLFFRRLYRWGAAVLLLWAADLAVFWFAQGRVRVIGEAIVFAAFFALQLWLGFRGNKLVAAAFLRRGWEPAR